MSGEGKVYSGLTRIKSGTFFYQPVYEFQVFHFMLTHLQMLQVHCVHYFSLLPTIFLEESIRKHHYIFLQLQVWDCYRKIKEMLSWKTFAWKYQRFLIFTSQNHRLKLSLENKKVLWYIFSSKILRIFLWNSYISIVS